MKRLHGKGQGYPVLYLETFLACVKVWGQVKWHHFRYTRTPFNDPVIKPLMLQSSRPFVFQSFLNSAFSGAAVPRSAHLPSDFPLDLREALL